MSDARLEGGNALRRCLLRLLLCEQAAYRVVPRPFNRKLKGVASLLIADEVVTFARSNEEADARARPACCCVMKRCHAAVVPHVDVHTGLRKPVRKLLGRQALDRHKQTTAHFDMALYRCSPKLLAGRLRCASRASGNPLLGRRSKFRLVFSLRLVRLSAFLLHALCPRPRVFFGCKTVRAEVGLNRTML